MYVQYVLLNVCSNFFACILSRKFCTDSNRALNADEELNTVI